MSGPVVALSWTAPTLNTDGSAITGALTYNVYQGTSATALTKVQSGLTATTVAITAGLTANSTQYFSVTAVESGVESAQIAAVAVAIPLPTPNPVTNLVVTLTTP